MATDANLYDKTQCYEKNLILFAFFFPIIGTYVLCPGINVADVYFYILLVYMIQIT